MMTFKDLKKLVELPSYKEQRVPTVKALEVSGVPVVTEKVLENHGSINVYQNGYVIYRAHKRVTVFSLRDCVHYKYDAAEGAGHHIEEAEFDDYEWHIRLVLEGEDRIFMNYEIIQGKWMPSREDREYKEEILEGVDEAVSTLERMISEERVEELLSTLTDLQRKVVHIHLFHGLSFTEAAKHLGMTRQNLTGIYNAAIYKIDEFHLLLKEEQTAAYSVEIWKRFRKWGGIPTGITQNIKDLLASREIENIFENSDFIYMLNQASGDRQILAKQLNISPFQLSYVTNSNEGEGLLFYGNTIIPFKDKFDTSLKLYGLMTTKPNEIAKYREKKDA